MTGHGFSGLLFGIFTLLPIFPFLSTAIPMGQRRKYRKRSCKWATTRKIKNEYRLLYCYRLSWHSTWNLFRPWLSKFELDIILGKIAKSWRSCNCYLPRVVFIRKKSEKSKIIKRLSERNFFRDQSCLEGDF